MISEASQCRIVRTLNTENFSQQRASPPSLIFLLHQAFSFGNYCVTLKSVLLQTLNSTNKWRPKTSPLFFLSFSSVPHPCTQPLDQNANYNFTNGTYYKSTATLVSCPSGFNVPANKTTVCQAGGNWSLPIPKCGEEKINCFKNLSFHFQSSFHRRPIDFRSTAD